jgi:TRAP-type C4-dicarboxylate transport system permease small subunit
MAEASQQLSSGVFETVLRGARALVTILRVLAGVLLVASVALNFANVVGRYFFNTSIYWAEEVMLFLMVGCVFFGNGVVAWSGRQIRMDVLLVMLPEKAREALNLISELVLIATALIIIVFASPVIRDLYDFDQRSQSAEVPLYILQALIPIGLAIMALLVLIRLLAGGARAASSGSSSH